MLDRRGCRCPLSPGSQVHFQPKSAGPNEQSERKWLTTRPQCAAYSSCRKPRTKLPFFGRNREEFESLTGAMGQGNIWSLSGLELHPAGCSRSIPRQPVFTCLPYTMWLHLNKDRGREVRRWLCALRRGLALDGRGDRIPHPERTDIPRGWATLDF